ncbi:MAG: penicillin-binding transpeptidase domain-containing protein [Thermodesulfobacteriota bacterium]|nr:penicillin-binding transpeptidase domain-containing protein [Thermodesulfobacteriota bacterium]
MKRKSINWFKVRVILISLLLSFCFVLIVGRMFQLQVLKKEQLYKLAARQQVSQIPLVPKRGTIYDRNENELAVSIEVDSVYAEAKRVVEVEKAAHELSVALQADQKELRQKLKSRKSFEWIQRKISPNEVEAVKTLHLSGIHFLKENKRFYPHSQLAAHIIGFVGLDSRGLEGIELQYDVLLNGKQNVWTTEIDAMGRGIMMARGPYEKEDHYRNVILTIDKQIQHVAETELSHSVQKWGAKGGMVIVMDPMTGKILAMASSPFFNPNQFIQSRPKSWRNRAVSDVFEPGSIFKAFLAAAVLEEKIVQPSDSFFCENGSYTIYDRKIRDHSKHGWLTFQQIIKFSSNIGAAKAAEKMGKERFYRYICDFGFGEKTRIGLPGEAKGILQHPRYWPPITLDTIAFGQGIAVTGIQMTAALSAIANGGILMKPYVAERITNERGEVTQSFKPEAVRRVISEETSRKVIALLKATTEKGGTGEQAVPEGYEVAGKTGTAQKVDSILGGYSEDKYTSGFMGFAPADEPKIVVLVVIDEPRGSTYGGIVAAPVFRAIVEKVLPYLNVFPKGTMIVKNELDLAPMKETAWALPVTEGVKVAKGAEKVLMPDLTGLPMRSALSRVEGKGMIIKVSGNGRLVEQVPRAGAIIEKGEICYLKFESPS